MDKVSARLSAGGLLEPVLTVLIGLGYVFSFLWVVENAVAPHFEYLGYTARANNFDELAVAIVGSILLCLLLPSDRTRPSSQAMDFLLCTVGLPLLFLPIYYGVLASPVLLLL